MRSVNPFTFDHPTSKGKQPQHINTRALFESCSHTIALIERIHVLRVNIKKQSYIFAQLPSVLIYVMGTLGIRRGVGSIAILGPRTFKQIFNIHVFHNLDVDYETSCTLQNRLTRFIDDSLL